jgi:hypothetical protein
MDGIVIYLWNTDDSPTTVMQEVWRWRVKMFADDMILLDIVIFCGWTKCKA